MNSIKRLAMIAAFAVTIVVGTIYTTGGVDAKSASQLSTQTESPLSYAACMPNDSPVGGPHWDWGFHYHATWVPYYPYSASGIYAPSGPLVPGSCKWGAY